MVADRQKRDLIRWVESEISRTACRCYRIDLESLSTESLRELQHFLRDLETEKQQANQSGENFSVAAIVIDVPRYIISNIILMNDGQASVFIFIVTILAVGLYGTLIFRMALLSLINILSINL